MADFEFETLVLETSVSLPEPLQDVASAKFPAFQELAGQLWPHGRAWTRDPSTVSGKILAATAKASADVEAQVEKLGRETDPATTHELLPEWERALGLPDETVPAGASEEERRAAVLAEIAGLQEVSAPALIAYAAGLGYAIALSHFAPLKAGSATAGAPVFGIAWQFTVGITYWGSGDRSRLEFAIRKIMPAHAAAVFFYGEFYPAKAATDCAIPPLESIL